MKPTYEELEAQAAVYLEALKMACNHISNVTRCPNCYFRYECKKNSDGTEECADFVRHYFIRIAGDSL